jgi:hypothetical protein
MNPPSYESGSREATRSVERLIAEQNQEIRTLQAQVTELEAQRDQALQLAETLRRQAMRMSQ